MQPKGETSMRISTVMLTIALAASTMMITQPTQGLAASKKVTAQTASWDGTWSGKWGGKASGKVTIKNNKVTSYYFQGRPQKVGGTNVSGNTIRFGSGYSVTMTKTGANSASAVWKGDGTAQAHMTR